MPNTLVTGAAGFIGSHFCKALLDAEPDSLVVGVDALLGSAYLPRLDPCKPFEEENRFLYYPTPIQNKREIGELIGDLALSRVVNFAAETHVDRSIGGPGPFVEHNIKGLTDLLQTACATWRKMGKDISKDVHFHQVSTDEVFGANGHITPESPYAPSSPYAASKAAGDMLLHAWRTTYGLNATLHHGVNTYGPWQHPEKLIPLYLKKSLLGLDFPLYGSGHQTRQWFHVRDHCTWLLHRLSQWTPENPVWRWGGTPAAVSESNRKILGLLEALLEVEGEKGATLETTLDRPGHDGCYRLSYDWPFADDPPLTSLLDGLQETVRWALSDAGRAFLLSSSTPDPRSLWATT